MSVAMDEMKSSSLLLRNEPMAKHTSWRVGGPADIYFRPGTVEDLQQFLRTLPAATPVHWIGLGSNLLVRDGGIRGAVIATAALMKELERLDDTRVRAGAGLPCASFARRCVGWQLGPAAFFAGIPGTIGGALAMNAGAFGGETWDRVESVLTIDRRGQCRTRRRDEFAVGYRRVSGHADEWFLAATWQLQPEPGTGAEALKAIRAQRSASQPMGQPSCGSVFRNPPGGYAGELIERAGLKGVRRGGAMVSDKHANFIINTGAATAEDIERLIDQVRAAVERHAGVLLEPEVRMIGERGAPA